jgi:hypothetical protein
LSLGTDLRRRTGVRVDHAASAQPLHLPSVQANLTDHIYTMSRRRRLGGTRA